MKSKWAVPSNYTITPVESVSACDLTKEADEARAYGEPVEFFRLEILNDDGYLDSVAGAMAWFPASARAAIAWGSDAIWVDATSPENAIENFAAGEQDEEE